MLFVALGARAARAQNNTNLKVYYEKESPHQTIGGIQAQGLALEYTDLQVLGTWSFEDKAGWHGYIYVDDAQEAKWENSNLGVQLEDNYFPINQMQRWKDGETALIIDDLDDQTAAMLRNESFFEPLEQQIEVKWQPLDSTNPMDGTKDLDSTKFRVTITNNGKQTLRLAPGLWSESSNPQVSFDIIRDGQKLTAVSASKAPDEDKTAILKPLGAGESWEQIVDLSQIADFSRAADYNVKVFYQLPTRIGGTPDEPVVQTVEFHSEFEFYLSIKRPSK